MKQIEIVQVGDSHWKKASRWEECVRLHDEIADEVEQRQPALFIHTGDLYDAAPTPDEQNAAERWLSRIAAVCPVVLIRGNHDPVGALAIMRRLETKYPIVVEERCGVHVVAGVAVACIAWPKKAELIASAPAGATAEEIGQLAQQALRNILSGLGDELAKHDGPRVLAMHAMTRGAKTSAGQPLVGHEMEIGVEDFALARADYVALGHIHCAQDWTNEDVPIVFSGSPRRTAYGEVEDKGFVSVRFDRWDGDVEPDARRWALEGWDRVKLSAALMLDVTGTWTDGAMVLGGDVALVAPGAEIRFTYTVENDRRAAAKLAAAELEAEWRALGAADVKPEEEVIPVSRARAPEIATAETTEDQLRWLWKARGLEIAAPRQARLFAKLAEVVGPAAQGARERGAFRITSIEHCGFATMAPVAIDLDATPGPLVAMVGKNGTGKSTTCELMFGGLYGDMPTRGTLGSLATSRNAKVRLGVEAQDGSRYIVTHLVNGETRKGSVNVTDADGRPVPELPDAQVSKFHRWVADRSPPASVVAASMFASQGSKGLLGMKEADLKAVILRAIGCEVFEEHAKTCRERARAARGKMEVAAGRLSDERARAIPRKDAERHIAAAEEAVTRAQAAVADELAKLERAKEAERTFQEQTRAATEAQRALSAAESATKAAHAKVADLEQRMRADVELLRIAGDVRKATEDLAALAARESSLSTEVTTAKLALELAEIEARAADAVLADARKRWSDLSDRVKKGNDRLRELPEVEAAGERVAELRDALAYAEKAADEAAAEVTRLQGVAFVGAEGRIKGLRGALGSICVLGAVPVDEATRLAANALDGDDAAVKSATETPGLVAQARQAEAAARALVKTARERLAEVERKAARLADLRSLATELAATRVELASATEAGGLANAAQQVAQARVVERRGTYGTLRDALAPLAADRARLAPLAARAPDVANANARIEALTPEVHAATLAESDARKAQQAIVVPAVAPFDPRAVDAYAYSHESAQGSERRESAQLARFQDGLATAIASETRQGELDAERAGHEEDVADWTHLGEALGMDGIQALLIDAAGPRLTTLANDLLHSCHGPRFTIRIDTAPLTADGKRQTEGCEIQVLDTKPGEGGFVGGEREGATFCGGELALLNEALGLALTMHVCHRSGLRSPTLVRDETAAALDAENGQAYVAMLRRAAAQVNAHRVIFVSHDKAMSALADGTVDLNAPRAVPAISIAAAESATAEAPRKRRTRKAAA